MSDLPEHWTNYRCAECGHLTINGSIHGCVSCLTKREPEPIEVAPLDQPNSELEELRAALASLVAAADAARVKSWNDVDTLRAFLGALERGRTMLAEDWIGAAAVAANAAFPKAIP